MRGEELIFTVELQRCNYYSLSSLKWKTSVKKLKHIVFKEKV